MKVKTVDNNASPKTSHDKIPSVKAKQKRIKSEIKNSMKFSKERIYTYMSLSNWPLITIVREFL